MATVTKYNKNTNFAKRALTIAAMAGVMAFSSACGGSKNVDTKNSGNNPQEDKTAALVQENSNLKLRINDLLIRNNEWQQQVITANAELRREQSDRKDEARMAVERASLALQKEQAQNQAYRLVADAKLNAELVRERDLTEQVSKLKRGCNAK